MILVHPRSDLKGGVDNSSTKSIVSKIFLSEQRVARDHLLSHVWISRYILVRVRRRSQEKINRTLSYDAGARVVLK